MPKCRCWKHTFFIVLFSAPLLSLAGSIHEAAIEGDLDELKCLISDGADVNAPDPAGTPLQWALFGDRPEVVRYLLEVGTDPNVDGSAGSTLYAAAGMGATELVQLLLDYGADPNFGEDGTPLLSAVRKGSSDTARLLLASGANANAATFDGTTALREASKRGNLELVKLLIDHGANANALTAVGKPPIHFAMVVLHQSVAAYLREHGATPGSVVPVKELLSSASVEKGKAKTESDCSACHMIEKGKKSSWTFSLGDCWTAQRRLHLLLLLASVQGNQ